MTVSVHAMDDNRIPVGPAAAAHCRSQEELERDRLRNGGNLQDDIALDYPTFDSPLWLLGGDQMGTIIRFPKQCQDTRLDYYGLELFVESCGRLLNTLPTDTRSEAKEEFNRLIEDLIELMDACQDARKVE